MKKRAIIGIGNILMSDEGVGVRIVERMSSHAKGGEDVDFVDAGMPGMRLLHLIAGRSRVVIVDCAMMGENPGTVRVFRPNDVKSCKALAGLSLHEGDLLTVLKVSRELDECPGDVAICGIEPVSVEQGEKLSRALDVKMGDYETKVWETLMGEE